MISALQGIWDRLRQPPPVRAVAEPTPVVVEAAPALAELTPAVTQPTMADELHGLRDELARLARAQARAALSAEAGAATARDALDDLRGACRARERDADDLRGALSATTDASRRAAGGAWLPVVDGIEACLEHARRLAVEGRGEGGLASVLRRFVSPGLPSEVLDDGVRGLELLHARALGVLSLHGASPMETADRAFDPTLHVAVDTVPGTPQQDGRVAREILRGYLLDGRPLRLAEVVIYKSKEGESPS